MFGLRGFCSLDVYAVRGYTLGGNYDPPRVYHISHTLPKSTLSLRRYWAERGLGYGFVDKVNIRVEWTFREVLLFLAE